MVTMVIIDISDGEDDNDHVMVIRLLLIVMQIMHGW